MGRVPGEEFENRSADGIWSIPKLGGKRGELFRQPINGSMRHSEASIDWLVVAADFSGQRKATTELCAGLHHTLREEMGYVPTITKSYSPEPRYKARTDLLHPSRMWMQKGSGSLGDC